MCEQDKAASYKSWALHIKVAMKGHGRGKKRLQHNIVDLILLEFQPETDEAFTVAGRKRAHTSQK